MFSILTRLRDFVDCRDANNTKIYKLGELALLCQTTRHQTRERTRVNDSSGFRWLTWIARVCVLLCVLLCVSALQHRSTMGKWSETIWEAQPLSPYLFRPRGKDAGPKKERYISADYKPNIRMHSTSGAAAGSSSEPATPKRKRKSEAAGETTPTSAKRRPKHVTEGGESEEEGGGSAKKPRVSSAKKKKPKVEKEEATPTRSRIARGAKAGEKTTQRDTSDGVKSLAWLFLTLFFLAGFVGLCRRGEVR